MDLRADILTDRQRAATSEETRCALRRRGRLFTRADGSRVGQAKRPKVKSSVSGQTGQQTCKQVTYADPKYFPGGFKLKERRETAMKQLSSHISTFTHKPPPSP